jgi:hypothetical protein
MQLYVDTCTFALYTMINIVNPSLLVVVLIQIAFYIIFFFTNPFDDGCFKVLPNAGSIDFTRR